MTSFRLTVPGNLLLAGEYAVLEPGGLGAAIAVEPRLVVTVTPEDRWSVVGRWTGGGEAFDPEASGEPTFAGKVFLKALEELEARGDERGRRWSRIPTARIEIDSSAFFDAQGRKRGFGSSAALAVGMAGALLGLEGREVGPSGFQAAVAAHRFAQGGAGSGYDVAASWHGGVGLFTGGVRPRWEPAGCPLPALAVFAGPQVVRTVSSIALFRAWQSSGVGREFLEVSNAAVRSLVAARTVMDVLSAWAACRDVGLELGRSIGSSAVLNAGEGLPEGSIVKALGAGNETGAVGAPAPPRAWPPGFEALELSAEGLRWE